MAQMKNLKIAVIMAVFVMAVANGSALLRARSSQSLESDLDVSEAIRNAKMRRKRARKSLTTDSAAAFGLDNDELDDPAAMAAYTAEYNKKEAKKCSNTAGKGDFVAVKGWEGDADAKNWGCADYYVNGWCTGNGVLGTQDTTCLDCPADDGDGLEKWPKNKNHKTAAHKCKECGCK